MINTFSEAEHVLGWLVQNAVITAILAGVVAVMCRRLRASPAIRHALWLMVLVKFVTPPVVAWPWQLPVLENLPLANPTSEAVANQESESSASGAPLAGVAVPLDTFLDLAAMANSLTEGAAGETVPGTSVQTTEVVGRQSAFLVPALLLVWLMGAVIAAVVQGVRIVQFRRLVVRGRPAPMDLIGQVRELADRLGVRPPRVLLVPGIHSPLVWGWGRPLLLWPTALAGRLSGDCRRSVLAHELAHLRRRDHWTAWLRLAAGCLWWWDPICWYANRQVRLNAELACDAWVLWAWPDNRRVYAEALIEVTEEVSRAAPPISALAMGGGARLAFRTEVDHDYA